MDRRDMLKTLALAAGGVGAAGAAAAAAPGPATSVEVAADPDATKRFAEALRLIAAYADAHRQGYGLPGLTLVCTAPGGYTAFVRSGFSNPATLAPLRADHLFQIGSISKSFVAMCVHQLAQEGRFALSDDIRGVLPGLALEARPHISLINLLQHSSGLPDDAPLFPRTPDGMLWSAFPPGSAWSYSNTGYDILGKVVERMDGVPLDQSLKRRIFGPLGMADARGCIMARERARYADSFTPYDAAVDSRPGGALGPAPWVNVTFGAGCVAATAADMSHWIRYLIAASSGRGAPLLPDAAARAYLDPGIAAPGWGAGGATYGSGLSHVPVEGRTLLHHTGGMVSFSSSIHVDPVAEVGCFASTNSGEQEYRPREVTAYACAVLRSVVEPSAGLDPKRAPIKPTAAKAPPRAQGGSAPEALAALAGRYENDDPWMGVVTIEARADGLYLEGETGLERHEDGYWTAKVPLSTERLRFEKPLNGRPQILNVSGVDYERRDV
jgi:CubicO group peptidase (beta-lactamase class C family)